VTIAAPGGVVSGGDILARMLKILVAVAGLALAGVSCGKIQPTGEAGASDGAAGTGGGGQAGVGGTNGAAGGASASCGTKTCKPGGQCCYACISLCADPGGTCPAFLVDPCPHDDADATAR
jgi:hypothetical protein